MTALEEQLRTELPHHTNTLMDYYPLRGIRDDGAIPAWVREPQHIDVTVFGPRQPERDAQYWPVVMRHCEKHGVRWSAGACWCCAAGIRPVQG